MSIVQRITFKIGNMRKAADWIVYPASFTEGRPDPTIFVQSDKRALSINPETKTGMLSNGKGHPGFISVSAVLGAVKVDVSDEILAMVQSAQAQKGDRIGPGVIVG